MTPELAYLLKVNVGIALFYAFYRLFFLKDTFFHWRRTALLCFFAVSLLYPLLNIEGWIKGHEPMMAMADNLATILIEEPMAVTAPQEADTSGEGWLAYAVRLAYWSGVCLLAARFLLRLGSIVRLHFRCRKSEIKGVGVHLLPTQAGPFSFFRWIFVHPQSHTDEELSEIITHEETHARQCHSADVMIAEAMCMLCWFNPFCWLMRREVRSNLEYMADRRVLETGHDSKAYQYHLLVLAHHHKAIATLSNNFNVLPLKNRINMMNRRRTRKIGRTKYAMFLPLAALLMIVSNIEVVARSTRDLLKQTPPSEYEAPITATPATADRALPSARLQSVPDSTVFTVVEEMPEFPGGPKALMEYIRDIRYPADAHAAGIEGRVITSFIVRKDGSIDNIRIEKSVSPSIDAEAKRIIAAMPRWKPGKQRGEAVNVKLTFPISFKLNKPADTPPSGRNQKFRPGGAGGSGICTQAEPRNRRNGRES